MPTRLLLIDANATSRATLRQLLQAHADVRVCAEVASLRSARRAIAETSCELIFISLRRDDGRAFDFVRSLPSGIRVVFVAEDGGQAFPAIEVHGLDYLLRPVTAAGIARALARRERKAAKAPSLQDEVVHLRTAGRARVTRLADICAIEAQENYTLVHQSNGSSTLVRQPLKAWAGQLPDSHFLRVHRTAIVNLSHIMSYRRESSRALLLEVRQLPKPLRVGRTFWPELNARLGKSILAERSRERPAR